MGKSKIYSGICLVIGIIGLLLIRAFESQLFYDPLYQFYKADYLTQSLPEFDKFKLLGAISLRYFLNTVFSLVIIVALFPGKNVLKICTWVYFIFFIVGIVLFYIVLEFFADQIFGLFYIRRFLIHPVLLLLIVPALFYQKKIGIKNS